MKGSAWCMKFMGAVCGDILGSSFESDNIKHIPTFEEMMSRRCRFTGGR
jgi:hypothetical protein